MELPRPIDEPHADSTTSGERGRPNGFRRSSLLLLLLGGLAVGSLTIGTSYYLATATQFQAKTEQQLGAIADLMAGELRSWRRERFSDARFYQNNLSLARLVRDTLARPDDVALAGELTSWFLDPQRSHGYGVFLLDPPGRVRPIADRAVSHSRC